MILLDTNILIEVLKNNKNILSIIEEYHYSELFISSISIMELYFGALNKLELSKLKRFVEIFQIVHISENISSQSTNLIYEYAKSHSLDIPDSLIASCAIEKNLSLFTLNLKDFRFIKGLTILNK